MKHVTVSRTSPLTGLINTMRLPTTSSKVRAYLLGRDTCPLVQDFFPELSDDEREFLLTGCTPDDFARLQREVEMT